VLSDNRIPDLLVLWDLGFWRRWRCLCWCSGL